jgi:hypothetical protein
MKKILFEIINTTIYKDICNPNPKYRIMRVLAKSKNSEYHRYATCSYIEGRITKKKMLARAKKALSKVDWD